MKNFLKIILLILIQGMLSSSLLANAQENFDEAGYLFNNYNLVPTALGAYNEQISEGYYSLLGIRKIGSIDFNELLVGLSRPIYYSNESETNIADSSGSRWSAINFPRSRMVILNHATVNLIIFQKIELDQLLLHEKLEAMMISDHDYQVSTALNWLLVRNLLEKIAPNEATEEFLDIPTKDLMYSNYGMRKAIIETSKEPQYNFLNRLEKIVLPKLDRAKILLAKSSGGSTSTGNGGDLSAALFKKYLLQANLLKEVKYKQSKINNPHDGLSTSEVELAIFISKIEVNRENLNSPNIIISKTNDNKLYIQVPDIDINPKKIKGEAARIRALAFENYANIISQIKLLKTNHE